MTTLQTLVIKTSDTSRANWLEINRALRRQGLELHRYHAMLDDCGMTILVHARHPDGDVKAGATAAMQGHSAETKLYTMH